MGERILVKHQAAIESTRGTDLAATRKVYGKGIWDEDVATIRPDNEERGVFVRHYRSQPGLITAMLPFEGTVTFEDLPWWLQCALKGGVTGVLSATSVYTYTFVPTQATDDLKSLTFETGDDTQAWEAHFGMVDSFEITAVLGQPLKFSAKLLLDDWTTATFTGSISDRVTEDALAHLGKIAIGNAGAVPSSYITGRLVEMKFGIENALAPKFFQDGAGQKFTGMGRGSRLFYMEPVFEGNAATITERANYDSKTARVLRWTVTGSNIAASSPTTPKTIDIVLPGIWTSYKSAERDTNTTFAGRLEAQYDSTLGYDVSVAIANALVTLP